VSIHLRLQIYTKVAFPPGLVILSNLSLTSTTYSPVELHHRSRWTLQKSYKSWRPGKAKLFQASLRTQLEVQIHVWRIPRKLRHPRTVYYKFNKSYRIQTPSRLLTLPLEIRAQIWKLVLSPSVLFTIQDTENEVYCSVDDLFLPPRNVDYVERLRQYYLDNAEDAVRNYSKSPKCESISYHKYLHDHALIRTNKQVRGFLVINTYCFQRMRTGLMALCQFLFSLEIFTNYYADSSDRSVPRLFLSFRPSRKPYLGRSKTECSRMIYRYTS
jgi:hypothetical protein